MKLTYIALLASRSVHPNPQTHSLLRSTDTPQRPRRPHRRAPTPLEIIRRSQTKPDSRRAWPAWLAQPPRAAEHPWHSYVFGFSSLESRLRADDVTAISFPPFRTSYRDSSASTK
jgi:hypothetical protein